MIATANAEKTETQPEQMDSASMGLALDQFTELSQHLAQSYGLLQNKVSELNEELITVSEQRLTELAEKERLAKKLTGVLDVLPGGVVLLDSKGRVVEANPAAHEMLGEPLEGQMWRNVITRSFAPRSDDGHEISTKDGRRISIATRSLESDGQLILLTDQTETRHLQAQVSRNERMTALGEMVSALAHQIRTPLSTAMLYAGHLSNGDLDSGKSREFSKKLANRLNHMERQVQDMLLFAKGELPLSDACTVGQLQEALAEELEVPLANAQLQCQWHVETPSQTLFCNREALIGAMLNLVNNALEAMALETEHKRSLQIQFRQQDDQLKLSVCDNGPGMSPETLKRVQDIFVTTKTQGTGLGLAVVQVVAHAHGGEFCLQSAAGVGTCAHLFLPVNKLMEV